MNKRKYSSGRIVKQALQDTLVEYNITSAMYGEDLREIRNWQWKTARKASPGN
jgi:hypothetical protein